MLRQRLCPTPRAKVIQDSPLPYKIADESAGHVPGMNDHAPCQLVCVSNGECQKRQSDRLRFNQDQGEIFYL
jgi:hypothetical protein